MLSSSLSRAALGLGIVLACAGCQPDTASKDGSAPVPPVPAEPAQVSDGVNLDLKPQIKDAVVSTDAGGAKMAVESTPAAVKLTMAQAGTSRAQLSAVLDPGEYDVHVQTGDVTVQDRATDGLGAFFGPENDRAASVELKPNADVRVHISVPTKRRAYYALGFGGWGKARGSMEIKTLELVKSKG